MNDYAAARRIAQILVQRGPPRESQGLNVVRAVAYATHVIRDYSRQAVDVDEVTLAEEIHGALDAGLLCPACGVITIDGKRCKDCGEQRRVYLQGRLDTLSGQPSTYSGPYPSEYQRGVNEVREEKARAKAARGEGNVRAT